MSKKRFASTMMALSLYSASCGGLGLDCGKKYHHKTIDRMNMKGMSSQEMGTAGSKKKSRKYRKTKRKY